MAGGYPTYQTITASGAATAVVVDWTIVPFNLSYAIELLNGSATFGVEYTLDDVNAAQFAQNNQGGQPVYATTTVTWLPDANNTSATGSVSGNYAFPVRAIRANVSTVSSATATIQFVVIQGLPYGT